jgi:hypothetical protein
LYRFVADNPPTAAVLDGKALVFFGDRKIELGKGRQTILGPVLRAEKFDLKQEDELYAWSNVRSEYEAAASYQAAKAVSINSYASNWWSYGYGGMYPGWFWNSAFNCYAWLPAYGAFYSPFGWGFYSPGNVTYAPVVTTPVYRGGQWQRNPGDPNWKGHHHWTGTSTNATVAIRTDRPPAVGVIASSPWATNQARAQAAASLAMTGAFNPAATRSGAVVSGSHVSMPNAAAVRGGGWSGAGSGGHAASAAGGWSGGGHASGGFSGGAIGGGGHASAGGGGGGGGGHH